MTPSSTLRAAVLPFATLGAACVVAGGLTAAATAPAPTELASWAAAYLVLVAGVAQIGLGVGQALLAARAPSGRLVIAEFAAFNAGNAAVMAGTLLRLPPVVDSGGALLVVSLVLLLRAAAGARPEPATTSAGAAGRRWSLLGYRSLVGLLLVSIPVGLVLAGLRAGG